ncbi:hypothetical protein L596_006641 [Steinernema carpocapsae]|uniref:Uncharacterized protein n=1 Tax=Steinernema carpocapsae TaxID=34508 RepID=A0A4V6I8V1_STECR|nr:hypothetical protein L596_006641 [Steinernema carpocapsae]
MFRKYLVVTENKNLSSMTASERLALSVVKPTNITIRKNLPESAIPPILQTDCHTMEPQEKQMKERIEINKDIPEYLSVGAWTGAVDHVLPRLKKKVILCVKLIISRSSQNYCWIAMLTSNFLCYIAF